MLITTIPEAASFLVENGFVFMPSTAVEDIDHTVQLLTAITGHRLPAGVQLRAVFDDMLDLTEDGEPIPGYAIEPQEQP